MFLFTLSKLIWGGNGEKGSCLISERFELAQFTWVLASFSIVIAVVPSYSYECNNHILPLGHFYITCT